MDTATITNAAAEAKSVARADLAAFQANPIGHAKSLFATAGRPTPISVIAWLSTIGIVLGGAGAVGALMAGAVVAGVVVLALLAIGTISTLGFFGMRKWAVVVYAGQFLLSVLMMLQQGSLTVGSFVIPAIVLTICAKYYGQMK